MTEIIENLIKKVENLLDVIKKRPRDQEKWEYRGSIYVQCGRKISTAQYENSEISISMTRRYDDDERDQIPDPTEMKETIQKLVKEWEAVERGGKIPANKPANKPAPKKTGGKQVWRRKG